MVVHDGNDRSLEIVIMKPLLDNKSYVIVENHVRELATMQKPHNYTKEDKLKLALERKDSKNKSKKTSKKHKTTEEICDSNQSTIDSKDLDELRTIYTKCKEVVRKIERKYGHLLEIEESVNSKPRKHYLGDYKDECTCRKRKKIVFDDEGKQSTVDMTENLHICVDKLKDLPTETQNQTRNIEVEYQDVEIELPDNLQDLTNMLHDPDIEMTLRNKVLAKIRLLKQEYSNEIKFNKHILIEKVKANCDDIFDFKGTNLSVIPGYS